MCQCFQPLVKLQKTSVLLLNGVGTDVLILPNLNFRTFQERPFLHDRRETDVQAFCTLQP